MNNTILLRPSIGAYFILIVVFSFPLVVVPIWMGFSKYLNSNYWLIHILLFLVTVIWFLYIYQELTISKIGIERREIRFFSFKSNQIKFSDVISWSTENPLKLYTNDGNVFEIRWTMFGKRNKKILFDTLKSKKFILHRATEP